VPLTAARWPDLEELFGERGACGGCWCMWWRLPRKTWTKQKGDRNRRAFRERVVAGPPPGLLAYRAGVPVGWCAVGPRAELPVLDRSRNLAPVDERPVWCVSCLFVRRNARGSGVALDLLAAAAGFAATRGATVLEGYPVDPLAGRRMPDAFVWTGTWDLFRRAGFVEIARRSPTRPVVRKDLVPTSCSRGAGRPAKRSV
jgi:GNAT superfamily N-acetyltransferase